MFTPPDDAKTDPRPLLVIANSQGKVRCRDAIRKWPYMRDLLALCSSPTPQEYPGYLAEKRIGTVIAGYDRIDMRVALETLNRQHGVKVMRVDSGGTLDSCSCMPGSLMRYVSSPSLYCRWESRSYPVRSPESRYSGSLGPSKAAEC